MRGYLKPGRRLAGGVVAVAAGLLLLAGCGADPAHLIGVGPGAEGTVGDGADQGTPGPGGSDPSPGATSTTGTGGSTGTGGGTSNNAIKPCTMITSQDATQALGTSANTTSDTDEECLYESGEDAVMLSVKPEPYDAATVNEISQLGSMVQKLDGIGDAAFRISVGSETQFHVWLKGKYVVVVLTKASGDTAGPGRALLDKVLAKV